MALVHDIGESIIGDITPHDNINRDEKHLREGLALQYLKIFLTPFNKAAADEAEALWQEFENGGTDVAKWVRDLEYITMWAPGYDLRRMNRRGERF